MDTDLVIRAQGGDQEAFADLVYAIADRFLAVSHRILSDIHFAEDATQQALLSIWQDLPHLRDPGRFEAWSYRLENDASRLDGNICAGADRDPGVGRGQRRRVVVMLVIHWLGSV